MATKLSVEAQTRLLEQLERGFREKEEALSELASLVSEGHDISFAFPALAVPHHGSLLLLRELARKGDELSSLRSTIEALAEDPDINGDGSLEIVALFSYGLVAALSTGAPSPLPPPWPQESHDHYNTGNAIGDGEVCGDGVDNEGDGWIDCADPDCLGGACL